MKVLLTGGAGFLGQYLAPKLAAAGHEVTILDLKPPAVPISDLEACSTRRIWGADITKPETLSGHFAQQDAVLHLAGIVSFWRKHADLLHRVNAEGTKNVLAAAHSANVSRFVHVSSVAAIGYGPDPTPIDETFTFPWPTATKKHYMYSKHLAELEVEQAREQGLATLIVNPGLMWGPGDLTNSAKLMERMARGGIPACPPGGTNIADVRDVAAGLVLTLTHGNPGERYILGGANLTFREVYQIMADELGVEAPKRMLPRWLRPMIYAGTLCNELLRKSPPPLTSDNVDSSYRCRYFSSEKARRELGWEAKIPFRQTIADSIQWLRDHNRLPPPST